VGPEADIPDLERTLEELRRREQQLRHVADAMPALISYVDSDRRYRFVNRQYESWFACSREQVIGKTIDEVLGAAVMARGAPYVERALRGEEVHFELEVPYPGGPRWVDAHYVPDVDGAGRVAGFSVLVVDVTARKRAEEEIRHSEARLRAILDHLQVGVGLTDASGQWILSNAAVRRFVPELIPSRDSARRDRWRGLDPAGRPLPPEDWPGARALRGETVSPGVEFVHKGDDGEETWLLVSSVPFRGPAGEVLGAISVVQDISEHKRAHLALRAADRRKDEFLATLAHELRNPLAPIRNAVQVLKAKGAADPEASWVPEVVERQLQHMSRLLEDLLDVSRIAHDKLELRKQRVELAEVVRTAIETSRPHLDGARHVLTVSLPDEPVPLEADPVRLAQVFSNLLGNAAKYTRPGGHIKITAARRGDELVVSVEDDGIGIAADMLPRVFDIFAQGERALERAQGGLGVGLSLVRGLVELHGGRIEARSDGPGKGSEFIVVLPGRAGRAAAAPPAHTPAARAAPVRRLLIVDDLRDSADSLAMLMRIMGHEVHTAYDGEEAIAQATALHPDVLVLDVGMPKPNGLDVCRHIRAQPWGKGALVVALTGWGREDDRRQTEDAGFDHHLVKPVDPYALGALLSSFPAR
jgi:PAS domain S-box-containing protein